MRMISYSSNDDFIVNGINGATGRRGLELTSSQLTNIVVRKLNRELVNDYRRAPRLRTTRSGGPPRTPPVKGPRFRGVKEGVDVKRLDQAGWGILFAHGDPQAPAILEALDGLLKLREQQAEGLYHKFLGGRGYRRGESKYDFLERHRVSTSGPVDPAAGIPYYLLLAGSPETIPYEFQYQLDIQYAVGRIHFDTLDEWEQYARSVVAVEKGHVHRQRTIALFGPRNPNDRTTQLAAENLIQPLEEHLRIKQPSWNVERLHGGGATRQRLESLLKSESRPALLFTASHGMEFPKNDPRQLDHQGALLCQDWPGPDDWLEPIPEDFYLAGDHLDSQTDVHGLITMHFACFGTGTPQHDNFSAQTGDPWSPQAQPSQLAERPFLAKLPQKLLSHPRGGALAAVGHVDRAWCYSFYGARTGEQTTAFETVLDRLLKGDPLGRALEVFNERYAELSSELVTLLSTRSPMTGQRSRQLLNSWIAHNDARNYIIVGDPAVRLAMTHPESRSGHPESETFVLQPWDTKEPWAGTEPPQFDAESIAKPLVSIRDEDWQRTPPAVQRITARAFHLIAQLRGKLDDWDPEK